MACMWNSPYIFLDKNKQSRAYMYLYAWCEIEGLMASGHKDHPYIVYMWVGMFNDILIIIWNKQQLHLLKLFVVFQFVLQGLITILQQMKQWALPTALQYTTLQMQVIPRWRKVILLTFYVICHTAFESTVIGQEL